MRRRRKKGQPDQLVTAEHMKKPAELDFLEINLLSNRARGSMSHDGAGTGGGTLKNLKSLLDNLTYLPFVQSRYLCLFFI